MHCATYFITDGYSIWKPQNSADISSSICGKRYFLKLTKLILQLPSSNWDQVCGQVHTGVHLSAALAMPTSVPICRSSSAWGGCDEPLPSASLTNKVNHAASDWAEVTRTHAETTDGKVHPKPTEHRLLQSAALLHFYSSMIMLQRDRVLVQRLRLSIPGLLPLGPAFRLSSSLRPNVCFSAFVPDKMSPQV